MRAVDWGPAVVRRLVAQRPPFSFLDRITGVDLAGAALTGCRHLSANEPVFAGHFPDAPIWPGALTIEGLAQACGALMAVTQLAERLGEDALFEALEHVELGATRHPGHDPAKVAALTEGRAPGLFGAADLKLVAPVFPGCRLDYAVRLTHRAGELVRFTATAEVGGRRVAQGTLTGAG